MKRPIYEARSLKGKNNMQKNRWNGLDDSVNRW